MKQLPEQVAEKQQIAFDAAVNLSETFLTSIEKLTQLNLNATRAIFEESSAIAHLCLNTSSPEEAVSGLNELLEPKIQRFGDYVRGIHEIAHEAASLPCPDKDRSHLYPFFATLPGQGAWCTPLK